MAENQRFGTLPLRTIKDANAIFHSAVRAMKLAAPLAGHLLRDRLRSRNVDIRQVTVADILAVLPELEESIRLLADDGAARASVEALRRL